MSERSVAQFVAEHLANADSQWSLGTFGGIAEFSRDRDEPASVDLATDRMSVTTARGGVRVSSLDGVRPFASETISKLGWNHRVALCLPEAACAMNARTTLTRLGPDSEALRPQDRDGVLFDLGLGARHADLCVRVADGAAASELDRWTGLSVFDPSSRAMAAILQANPHRVFMSRVGRIEVYQPIPPASGRSPDGPHTHVLPKLLQHRRTHAATEPVPDGWIPCAHLYPPHPIKDGSGHAKMFDEPVHDAFQAILAEFGDRDAVQMKTHVGSLVRDGREPMASADVGGRNTRMSVRVALRQLKAQGLSSPALTSWLAAFEPADDDADEDTQALGHS